jgi:hypothetical protein
LSNTGGASLDGDGAGDLGIVDIGVEMSPNTFLISSRRFTTNDGSIQRSAI